VAACSKRIVLAFVVRRVIKTLGVRMASLVNIQSIMVVYTRE